MKFKINYELPFIFFTYLLFIIISCGFIKINKTEIKLYSSEKQEEILWTSDKKLEWHDFKGAVPIDNGNIEATTHCVIKIIETTYIKEGLPNITVGTFFLKNKSWTTTDNKSTLDHEQLHFDLYELYTRKVRKKFKDLNSKGIKKIKIYHDSFREIIKKGIERNASYDSEVYFNEIKQKEWSDQISIELLEL